MDGRDQWPGPLRDDFEGGVADHPIVGVDEIDLMPARDRIRQWRHGRVDGVHLGQPGR